VVVFIAEQEEVLFTVELVSGIFRVIPRAGGLGRADVSDLDRDGPDVAFLVLED
jgi:hypothetical protein